MKTRWLWGAGLVVVVAGWAVLSPVTQARVDALVEELGPRVEAAVGSPLPDDLQVLLLSRDELLDRLTADRAAREGRELAAGESPEPHWDDEVAVRGNLGIYTSNPSTIVICRTNVISLADEIDASQLDVLRVTLIHELVHAADAAAGPESWQRIESLVETDEHVSEAESVLVFLAEGHAEALTRRIAASAGEREAAARWSAEFADDWSMTVRYLRSAEYLERLASQGADDAFAAALAAPPTTYDALLYSDLDAPDLLPAAPDEGLEAALWALADGDPRCVSPRIEPAARHELEAGVFRADAARRRAAAAELVRSVELVGDLRGRGRDAVPFARVHVFASARAAEEYLDVVREANDALASLLSERADAEPIARFDEAVEVTDVDGAGWRGLLVARSWRMGDRWPDADFPSQRDDGKDERRSWHARRGPVVVALPPLGDNDRHLTPEARLDAAFALIPAAR